jgi:hypothetical protein
MSDMENLITLIVRWSSNEKVKKKHVELMSENSTKDSEIAIFKCRQINTGARI